MVNCSQKQFIANLLTLFVSYAIFRLIDFSSEPFDFSSLKTGLTGSAQRALSGFRVFQLCFSSNCFGDIYLYLWCEGWFLEVGDTSSVDSPPPLLPHTPHRAHAPPPPQCAPPPPNLPPMHTPPPTPWLATEKQPLAKNANLYFAIFFQVF